MNNTYPIFVVGSPRSGTTLLRSILDAHPNICCPQWETGIFISLSGMLDRDCQWHAANDSLIGDLRGRMIQWARDAVENMMAELTQGIAKPRWAEKTPAHAQHLRLIHEVFPEAQILHIIRDGRDVVRSLQNMAWTPQKIRWSTKCWMKNVETGRAEGRALPSKAYREIRYEELTNSPEKAVRSVCDFLQEDFHPQMLSFNEPKNNSWGNEQQPISTKSINRHRNLSPVEKFIFGRMASPLMKELGYRS